MSSESPKIKLYTNHGCGWSHRVHTTLKELDIPYEEELMDLDLPRPDWYLKMHPRGLVPTLTYSCGAVQDKILNESAVIVNFLLDAHGPDSHLVRPSHIAQDPKSVAYFRANANYIVEMYFSQVNPAMFAIVGIYDQAGMEAKANELVEKVEKYIEPLLADANPFFGGSDKLTFAEVMIIPFVIRLIAFSDGQILPTSLATGLKKLPNFSKWADAACKHPNITYIWNEEYLRDRVRERLPAAKAKYAAAK